MDQREQDIQNLLIAMNEEFEINGYRPGIPAFNFEKYNNSNIFIQKLGFKIDYLHSLINICESRGYVERTEIGPGYSGITLTYVGKQQALMGNNQQGETLMNIEQITIHGPTQIGNGNIQNFSNYLSIIEGKINDARVSDAEKKEAKSLLLKLTENPLLNTIIGGLLSGFMK